MPGSPKYKTLIKVLLKSSSKTYNKQDTQDSHTDHMEDILMTPISMINMIVINLHIMNGID